MKLFSTYFLLVLGLVLAVSALGCRTTLPEKSTDLLHSVQQRDQIIVGTKYDSPPFGYLDKDGQLKGLEVELAHEIAKRLLGDPNKVKFVQVNSSTRVAALNARHVDFVLATMTITPERKQVVNFTEPYYKSAQAIMVRENSGITSINDLADKRVNYVIGTTGEANLKKVLPKAKLLGFKSNTEAFSALSAGRADAFSQDDSILYGFLHEHCDVKVLPDRISEEPYGIAFRKDARSKPLQDAIQKILDDMAKEEYLQGLRQKWVRPAPPTVCAL